jgi:hypothetical protein
MRGDEGVLKDVRPLGKMTFVLLPQVGVYKGIDKVEEK